MSSAKPWSRAEFPSRPFRLAITSVFGLVAIFGCMPISDALAGPSDAAVWLMVIVLPLVWGLTTFIHETGHALGARAIGWRVHLVAVKPFAFRPAQRKIGLAPPMRTGDVGGFVFATPELFGRWSRKRAFFFAAGAAANLIWGTLALILAAHLPAHPKWSNVFGALGLVSLTAGVFNLVPMWWKENGSSDGALLWDLWKGRQPEEVERYIAWFSGLFFDGVPPRLWPSELVARAQDVYASGDRRRDLDSFLVMHYLSAGRLPDARKALERSDIGKAIPELAIGHAFLLCVMDKDGDRARAILEQVPERYRRTFYFCRSDALAHFHSGKESEARAAAMRAEQFAMKQGIAMAEEDKAILSAVKEGRPITIQLSSMDIQPA